VTKYVAFIGPPGSGKTTQIMMLRSVLGASQVLIASVPRLMRGEPDLMALLTTDEHMELNKHLNAAHRAKEAGVLAPIQLDELLFKSIGRASVPLVAMDGCPRGAEPARAYLKTALPIHTHVVHLTFAPEQVHLSLARQYSREVEKRGEEAAQRRQITFLRKLLVYLDDTTHGVQLLKEAGVGVTTLSAVLDPEIIHRTVMTIVENELGSEFVGASSNAGPT